MPALNRPTHTDPTDQLAKSGTHGTHGNAMVTSAHALGGDPAVGVGAAAVSRRSWLGGAIAATLGAVGNPAAAATPYPPPIPSPVTNAPTTPRQVVPEPATPQRRTGTLMIVGGAEDRLQDRVILRSFVERCGGPAARILVCTAASSQPEASWKGYQPVFESLGVADCQHLAIATEEEANDPARVDPILQADGIWLGGGDQRRFMSLVWESAVARALHLAFHLRGAHIGGTSAGAAALSRHMLAIGEATVRPEKDVVSVDIGLGFVSSAIVDQHFSERGRLGRLLSAMAQRPDLLGVGVDEDTALVIERGRGVAVIGSGNVTLVDGRHMATNFKELGPSERLEMLGVQLHLLPSGSHYAASAPRTSTADAQRHLPAPLRDAIALLVEPGPIRG